MKNCILFCFLLFCSLSTFSQTAFKSKSHKYCVYNDTDGLYSKCTDKNETFFFSMKEGEEEFYVLNGKFDIETYTIAGMEQIDGKFQFDIVDANDLSQTMILDMKNQIIEIIIGLGGDYILEFKIDEVLPGATIFDFITSK